MTLGIVCLVRLYLTIVYLERSYLIKTILTNIYRKDVLLSFFVLLTTKVHMIIICGLTQCSGVHGSPTKTSRGLFMVSVIIFLLKQLLSFVGTMLKKFLCFSCSIVKVRVFMSNHISITFKCR